MFDIWLTNLYVKESESLNALISGVKELGTKGRMYSGKEITTYRWQLRFTSKMHCIPVSCILYGIRHPKPSKNSLAAHIFYTRWVQKIIFNQSWRAREFQLQSCLMISSVTAKTSHAMVPIHALWITSRVLLLVFCGAFLPKDDLEHSLHTHIRLKYLNIRIQTMNTWSSGLSERWKCTFRIQIWFNLHMTDTCTLFGRALFGLAIYENDICRFY